MDNINQGQLRKLALARCESSKRDILKRKLIPIMVLCIDPSKEVPAIIAFQDYSREDIELRLTDYLQIAKDGRSTLIVSEDIL